MSSTLAYIATAVCLLVATGVAFQMFRKPKWDPRGQHCYVTGGTAGLGLALAISLTKRGADVSIVARNEERLQKALAQLEAVRQTPNQILKAYSYHVDTAVGASDALEAACEPHGGRCPDALFLCAGKSRPGFWVEQDEASLELTMRETYWAQAWTALAATKRMVKRGSTGKIVFVASVLGYFSMVGYAPYSPGKHAIRGLAETLQSELMLYDIDVHICFPASILSPGFVEENKIKPEVTLKIEEADKGADPSVVAEGLLKGVQKGHFHITYDFIGDVFRASTAGSTPRNGYFMDMLYSIMGFIALPLWRRDVDKLVKGHKQKHHEYLAAKGFFDDSGIPEVQKS